MANLSSTTDIASSSRPPPPLYVCEALDEDLKVPSIPGPDEVAAYKADRSFVRALREPLREEITSDLIKRRLQDLIDEGLACSEHLEGSEDVERVLETAKSYPMRDYHDPREMYHFYARRKSNATFRKKSCMRGPKRTIEEYIICYMLKHEMIKSNGD